MEALSSMNKYHRSYQFDELKGHRFYPFKDELELMAISEQMQSLGRSKSVKGSSSSPTGTDGTKEKEGEVSDRLKPQGSIKRRGDSKSKSAPRWN